MLHFYVMATFFSSLIIHGEKKDHFLISVFKMFLHVCVKDLYVSVAKIKFTN